MTTVKAHLNTLRISPRKVRLVAGLIKGKRAQQALDQMLFVTKRSVAPLTKLVKSGIANAESMKLDAAHLWIKDLQVNEGVKLKRWRPKGFGRASPIQKKTSRISLVLEHREPPKVEAKAEHKSN